MRYQTCNCEGQFSRQKEVRGAGNMSREEQLYESIEFVKESEICQVSKRRPSKKQEFLMQAQQHNGFHVGPTAGLQSARIK